jgi:uncharacterized protein YgiM (DUF1202 family)
MRSSYRHLFAVLILTFSACSSAQLTEPQAYASTAPVAAIQESNAVAAIVKAQNANLRDAPSQTGKVATTVSNGNLLSLISSKPTGPWYRVRDSKTGVEGWIHGNTIALLQTTETSRVGAKGERPRTTSPPESGRSYVNVDGVRVPSPVFTKTKPAGATARCRDGSYSFSQHRRGTCSHHGGVAQWY